LPHIVGGTEELERLVKDVFSLMKGEPGSHSDFFGFTNWDEVISFSESEEGTDLRPFVTLVQKNGPSRLWSAIKKSSSDEAAADVAISTAHKAKGCEWNSVQIAEDFASSTTRDEHIPESEARLFYVAITRAKNLLSVSDALLAAFTKAPRFVRDADLASRPQQVRRSASPSAPIQLKSVRPPGAAPTLTRANAGASRADASTTRSEQLMTSTTTSVSQSKPNTIPAGAVTKPKKGFWSFLGFGRKG
jgi:ATP-dependent exoDNAse (exonuclease V) beta subunit